MSQKQKWQISFIAFFTLTTGLNLDFYVFACVAPLLKHLIEFALFDFRGELDYKGYKCIKLRHS